MINQTEVANSNENSTTFVGGVLDGSVVKMLVRK